MARKKFYYKDYRYLNELVHLITGENCKLSVILMPNVPEFINFAERRDFIREDGSINRAHDIMNLNAETHALIMMGLCEKYHIMPFWSFQFDNNPSQWRGPIIKYEGYNFGHSIYDEPYHMCVHPFWFTQGRKWYSIKMENYLGEKSVEAGKMALDAFIEQGYVVTQLYAGLNPRIRTADHYCDYEEYDGQLFASLGEIEFTNVPGDFELPKKIPKIMQPTPRLEESIKNLTYKNI